MDKINIDQFVKDYLATASWVTCDSDECQEFTKEAQEIAKQDCITFISLVTTMFGMKKAVKLLTVSGTDLCYLAPHDFFLTRNHHGAGFWDKPDVYGQENADKLTEICHSMGEVDVYHIRGKKSKLTF